MKKLSLFTIILYCFSATAQDSSKVFHYNPDAGLQFKKADFQMSLLVDAASRLKALFCIAVTFIQSIGFPCIRQIGPDGCVQRRRPLYEPTSKLVRPGKKPAPVAGFAEVSAILAVLAVSVLSK